MGPDGEERQPGEEEEEEDVPDEAQQQEEEKVRAQEKKQRAKEEEEEDAEERERVNALQQRKRLLQELGVVDQLHQLLQGHTSAGSQQTRAQVQQRQQQTKVRPRRSPERPFTALFSTRLSLLHLLCPCRWIFLLSFTKRWCSSLPLTQNNR